MKLTSFSIETIANFSILSEKSQYMYLFGNFSLKKPSNRFFPMGNILKNDWINPSDSFSFFL
jgi:hypothetical protein